MDPNGNEKKPAAEEARPTEPRRTSKYDVLFVATDERVIRNLEMYQDGEKSALRDLKKHLYHAVQNNDADHALSVLDEIDKLIRENGALASDPPGRWPQLAGDPARQH